MAKKKETGKKIGHAPKIEANWESIKREINMHQVIYWIGLQATAEEIAGSFRCSVDTLDRRLKEELGESFAEVRKRLGNGADGRLSVRRSQFKLAQTNATMAIWLGKNWLGQSDKIEFTDDAKAEIRKFLQELSTDSVISTS